MVASRAPWSSPSSRSLREEEPVEIAEPSTKPKRGIGDLGERRDPAVEHATRPTYG